MCFDIWCQWNWAGGLIPLKIRRGKKGVMYLCIRIAQNGLKSRYVIGVERHVVRIKKGESSNEPWLSITAASFKAHDLIGVQWHIIKNHLAFKSLLEKKKKTTTSKYVFSCGLESIFISRTLVAAGFVWLDYSWCAVQINFPLPFHMSYKTINDAIWWTLQVWSQKSPWIECAASLLW